jgi:hypothetical protein
MNHISNKSKARLAIETTHVEHVGSANENAQVKEIKLPILLDSRLEDFLGLLGWKIFLDF